MPKELTTGRRVSEFYRAWVRAGGGEGGGSVKCGSPTAQLAGLEAGGVELAGPRSAQTGEESRPVFLRMGV